MLVASSVYAQKVYYWKDEKGVMNATTTPPPDNIKNFDADNWGKRDSPEEIQRYQAEQKAKEQRREAELHQKQQINRAQEEAQKQKDRQQAQQEARQQQQKAQEEIKCYTQQDPGILVGSGPVVIPGASYRICRDKNGKGKIVSKERL